VNVAKLNAAVAAPKYLQLASIFERQMRIGVLRIGDRLPSVRQLRDEYRISIATAVGCYFWLERQGYVRARAKSGYYVSRTPMAEGPTPAIVPRTRGPVPVQLNGVHLDDSGFKRELLDLGPAVIAPELLPMNRLNRSVRMAMSAFADHAVRYEDPRGNLRLRRQIARMSFRRGATCTADDILITAGGTEALSLCVRAVTKPGDVVAVESPGCYEILQALEAYGLRAIEIPHVTGKGINREALAAAIDRHTISAVLMEATCHNALGDCTSDDSKAAIVALAARHNIPILEGDAFGDLVFSGERPRPLKAFDRTGIVIQCVSLAHHVAPGFNIGWASAGRWHREVERRKSYETIAAASLPQIALAEFLESGAFDKHIRRLRPLLWQIVRSARDEILRRFPEGTRVSSPDGGFVLWVQMPDGNDGVDIQHRAAARGIRVLPGTAFSASGQYKNCIRVSCGYPFDRLKPAIRTLASLVAP
jgi:DNA-binding transcriptional MocR family regulator